LLRKSGLKANESKTDLCLFYKKDGAPVTIVLDNTTIISKNVINILRVLLDSKMQ
jgi:hypothetical protein